VRSEKGWAHASEPDVKNKCLLGVGKAPGFAAELFEQHAILVLEIIDDVLLVPVHPAGHGDEKELEVRGHEVENPSRFFATQPCGWTRLSFCLPLQL
jgi:hypothetical protein